MTLATLLEVLDGVMEMDGRMLVITTNYPEKLDRVSSSTYTIFRPAKSMRPSFLSVCFSVFFFSLSLMLAVSIDFKGREKG